MPILVDTSIWIGYFRKGLHARVLEVLIDENLIVTNDLILAELIPFLTVKQQTQVIQLLQALGKLPLRIEWGKIIELQVICLQSGLSGVGIPDLVIAQNAKQNHCPVYAIDKHFRRLRDTIYLELYQG